MSRPFDSPALEQFIDSLGDKATGQFAAIKGIIKRRKSHAFAPQGKRKRGRYQRNNYLIINQPIPWEKRNREITPFIRRKVFTELELALAIRLQGYADARTLSRHIYTHPKQRKYYRIKKAYKEAKLNGMVPVDYQIDPLFEAILTSAGFPKLK